MTKSTMSLESEQTVKLIFRFQKENYLVFHFLSGEMGLNDVKYARRP